MAVYNSDQVTSLTANPRGFLKPTEFGGRVRIMFWTITLPASGLAIGDSIQLGYLPKGARIIEGVFAWDTAQGVTATTAIGVSGTTGKYFAAAVTNSTAQNSFANTIALNWGSEEAAGTTSDKSSGQELLIATNAAAAWTASSKMFGYVMYVVD